MTTAIDDRLRGELLPGEQVVWAGRPVLVPKLFVTTRLLPPFAVLWVVVSAGRLLSVVRGWRKDEVGFEVVAVATVLLAVGLWLLLGPMLTQWVRAHRSAYAITDRRILLVERSAPGPRTVTARDLRELGSLSLIIRRDGAGTIRLGISDLTLDDIPDADRVFDLLRERVDAVR